jgi:uncharacterized protein (TIGR00369 family)
MADGEGDKAHKVRQLTEGPWAGWNVWIGDAFEDHTGPFYFRDEADGAVRCAFRAEKKHLNGSGNMHGGCMMTFADYSLFMIGRKHMDGSAVTISLNGEFVGPAAEGDLIEATGEVVRAGGSLLFVRGIISTGGKAMLAFSGVVKKVRPRPVG